MPKKTIEVNDVLPTCVEDAIEAVKQLLVTYLATNDCDELPCLHNDLDYSGDVHSVIDGEVPIYTADIEAAWFLHGRDLEEAYETTGIGTNPRENNGMAAIYCYIEQKVCEWYHDHAEEVFEESKSSNPKEGDE
jgi:hypothetical protein